MTSCVASRACALRCGGECWSWCEFWRMSTLTDLSMTDILRDLEGVEKLTPRERECLLLVNQHLSSKEIGRRLGLSKYTVDDHLAAASRRLGVATRRAAAQKLAAHEAQ